MMGRNAGMTRRIVALFNTSMRMKVKEDTEKSRNYSPLIPSRTVRGIYSCVDSGKLWSIKKQISNSVETARYKHYSACSGILTANPLIFCFLEHPRMFRAESSL